MTVPVVAAARKFPRRAGLTLAEALEAPGLESWHSTRIYIKATMNVAACARAPVVVAVRTIRTCRVAPDDAGQDCPG